jgi:hypothetical protein
MQTMRAFALERALITYARVFPIRKGKLRVIDWLWRAAAGSRGTARLAYLRYGGLNNNWRDAGNWLQGVTDIIARRFES